MPIYTPNYKLASPVAGEVLDPIQDSQRFLTIDRQLLGLFQVLGNGVVTGWIVADGGGLSVSISPGRGHINFLSGSTNDVATVSPLVPNTINYIYAQATDTMQYDRLPRFYSDLALVTGGIQILLAAVTTNASAIVSIDTSGRQDISFIQEIKTLINQHRHRGGADNPTKIDLTQEVMGQLPGFHIDNIDASKVTSGILPLARIPQLEHSDLLHSGVLTHAQLDSFVRNLSNPNVRLLGELSSTALMQLYLAFKHIWNDVDAFATNLLVMVPGIAPDSFTDFNATTAVVDKVNHLIQGIPSLGGQLVTTTFSTDNDFLSAVQSSNIEIGTDNFGDFFRLTKPLTQQIVESFDNVFGNNQPIPGWTLETVASDSTTSFTSDDTQQVDGAFSAKLNVSQSVRVQVTKVFSNTVDWSAFNEIQAYIETLSSSHGKIIFQILKNVGGGVLQEIDSFPLLLTNETTVGFKQVTHDLTNDDLSKVDAIRIFTDTSVGWDLSPFIVNIDRIILNNNLFFSPSGRIRFRLKVPQKAHWAAISWVVDDTTTGTVQARARSAPSFQTFDQSSASQYSSFFSNNGGDPSVPDNACIEAEIALTPNGTKTTTPVIRSVTISYITNSTTSGLHIDSVSDFMRATKLVNAAVVPPGDVIINGRIDVGDVVYGIQHSVQQASLSNNGFGTVFGTPVVGVDGTSLPLSPNQAVTANSVLKTSSLNGVASVQRMQDRSYLVADTLNDRIVQFNRQGQPVKVLASNNVKNVKDLYPISVCYNPGNTTLYIAWSVAVSLSSLDLSQIVISGAGLSLTLSNVNDHAIRSTSPNSQTQNSNVTPIILSPVHAGEIQAFLGDATTQDHRLFADIGTKTVKSGINSDNANFATLVTARGMPIFVGDFQFVTGLFRPISITITSTGNWLIGNAKPLLTTSGTGSASGVDPITGVSPSDITSTIEMDPDTGEIVFSDNSVDYSLLTLGGAIELNPKYIAVAGIVAGQGAPSVSTAASVTASVGGGVIQSSSTTTTTTTNSSTTTQTSTDLTVLLQRVGVIKTIEKSSGRVVDQQSTSDGTYAADVQIDENGDLVSIEKSFSNGIGTGRVIKLDEDGNIFFQFGLAELASPNDVRVLSTGNMIVST